MFHNNRNNNNNFPQKNNNENLNVRCGTCFQVLFFLPSGSAQESGGENGQRYIGRHAKSLWVSIAVIDGICFQI